MIPLPNRGRPQDWRMNEKKKVVLDPVESKCLDDTVSGTTPCTSPCRRCRGRLYCIVLGPGPRPSVREQRRCQFSFRNFSSYVTTLPFINITFPPSRVRVTPGVVSVKFWGFGVVLARGGGGGGVRPRRCLSPRFDLKPGGDCDSSCDSEDGSSRSRRRRCRQEKSV